MIIQETNIPDVTKNNIDESKQALADNIIQSVYPLFDEIYNSKLSGIAGLKNELKEKRQKVKEEKNELERIMAEYERMKKISKLLDRIEKLITSGLVYDGSFNHEIKILLKVVNNLSDDKLNYHLNSILQTISKRFSR